MWITWFFVLIVLSALAEGVLAAIMRLDKYELERRARLGSDRARAVSPLRQRGRELALVFMLLSVLAGSGAIAIALSQMSLWSALLLATLMVVFSRLIARSLLQGKGYKLAQANAGWLVRLLDLLSPVIKPLSEILMRPSAKSGPAFLTKQELIEVLDNHQSTAESDLTDSDLDVARSALQFTDKTAQQVMTARGAIVSVKSSQQLSLGLLDKLHSSGHRYFPVSKGKELGEVIGVLDLSQVVEARNSSSVDQLDLVEPVYIPAKRPLMKVLDTLKDSDSGVALVTGDDMEIIGLISLSDLLDELFGSLRKPSPKDKS